MLLTIKLSSLAYQLYDGTIAKPGYDKAAQAAKVPEPSAEDAAAHKRWTALQSEARRVDEFASRAVEAVPSPLAFLAFVFAPCSFFAGPAFTFRDYEAGVTGALLPLRDPSDARKGRQSLWGSRLLASLGKLFAGLMFMAIAITAPGGYHIPLPSFVSQLPVPFLQGRAALVIPGLHFTHAFTDHELLYATPLLMRILYVWATCFVTRAKYYGAWLVAEGSANMAGFGYQPPKIDRRTGKAAGAGDWAGVNNMDVVGFELAPTVSAASKAWNKRTQQWLATYLGKRVPRAWSVLSVYSLSAFWHGFYPGYYLFFLFAPFLQKVEVLITQRIRPRVHRLGRPAVWLYNVLGALLTSAVLNYAVCPFIALGWTEGFTMWASFYYIGHIVCVVLYLVLRFLVPAPHRPHHHVHSAQHAAKKVQ
jgi:hypothetical protein